MCASEREVCGLPNRNRLKPLGMGLKMCTLGSDTVTANQEGHGMTWF